MLKSCCLTCALLLAIPVLEAQTQQSLGWTTYNGSPSGNRLSPLSLINTSNVASLQLLRSFAIPNPSTLEVTPLVNNGVMFVAAVNSVYSFNLVTGKPGWSFMRPPTPGVVQDAGSGINRGAAASPGGIFISTDNAHLLSLNPTTGALQWETVMADYTQNYGTTAAPLYLSGPNLVISGVSGGDSGVRGFVAAYDAATGDQVWQFYTTPSGPSDPLAATWGDGLILPHGCGATWLTGTFDQTSNTLYWGVGNPCPDFDGDNRQGADLYTSSVLALNASTGALLWYYQFTPHNLWDYDGTPTPLLVDTNWQGVPRNLLMHANRNGYFYVLDRTTGQYLAGYPFVENLNWSMGLDSSGQPMMNTAATPTTTGATVCPGQQGANNYQSVAYSPTTGLFYVQALESCTVYVKESLPIGWLAGQEYGGGMAATATSIAPQKHLRAINPVTGAIAWDYAQQGYGQTYGGVMATAGGLVFFGDDNGSFSAVNAATGVPLWSYRDPAGKGMKSSPMSFELNGKQYVAIAFRSVVDVFGLPPAPGVFQTCPANSAPVGLAYSSTLTAGGGTPPYTFSITQGSLPAGLTLNSTTGAITGTPTTGGAQQFAAVATDSTAKVGSASCAISVTPLPVILGCPDVSFEVGVPGNSAMTIYGGVPPYTFSIISGGLPTGVALNQGGFVSGIPTTAGTYTYTLQVADSSGTKAGKKAVKCAQTIVASVQLGCAASTGKVGMTYSSLLAVNNGLAPFIYSITAGMLPPGLTLDSATGAITGTPTTSGTYTFTAEVEDSTGLPGGTATVSCTITIAS